MTPWVVVKSLAQIGASTKLGGEAIGHKGIAFKSVLELTQAPQTFSGLQEKAPILAVGFDPYRAHDPIERSSRDWHTLVQDVPNLDNSDPLSAVRPCRSLTGTTICRPRSANSVPRGSTQSCGCRRRTVQRTPEFGWGP